VLCTLKKLVKEAPSASLRARTLERELEGHGRSRRVGGDPPYRREESRLNLSKGDASAIQRRGLATVPSTTRYFCRGTLLTLPSPHPSGWTAAKCMPGWSWPESVSKYSISHRNVTSTTVHRREQENAFRPRGKAFPSQRLPPRSQSHAAGEKSFPIRGCEVICRHLPIGTQLAAY